MAFLDKNGLQHLTNRLVQGDAIKVASHRGHTVSKVLENIQRECDNVANPLEYKMENRIAEFKIGKGRDVDVSGDVEEGKVEVELKGKTYQNLLDDSEWLHVEKTITSNHSNNVALTSTSFLDKSILTKPSTKYTLILNFDILLNTLKNTYIQVNYEYEPNKQASLVHIDSNNIFLKNGGEYRVSFTTPENFQRMAQIFIGGYGGILTIKSNGVTLLEGDYTQTPIKELPKYFERIKSSFEDGIVDVDIKGQNLWNMDTVRKINRKSHIINSETSFTIDLSKGGGVNSAELYYDCSNIDSRTFCLSYDIEQNNDTFRPYLKIVYEDDTFVKGIPSDESSYSYHCYTNSNKKVKGICIAWETQTNGGLVTFKNIQLINISKLLPFEEPYKKKYSFNITEPLRSLPNGVCDEIRNNNGQWELVRRIHKIILDGTNGITWSVADNVDYTGKYIVANSLESKGIPLINNKVGAYKFDNQIASSLVINNPYGGFSNADCIWALEQEGMQIRFRISNIEQTSNGLNEWLKVNPVTFIYELETPIITPIDPIEFDIKPLSSIVINSDVVPESIHTVQLNRAAQIERGIIEIAELKKRVNTLEATYNSYFLENYHKLNLLNLEYEMERMIE